MKRMKLKLATATIRNLGTARGAVDRTSGNPLTAQRPTESCLTCPFMEQTTNTASAQNNGCF